MKLAARGFTIIELLVVMSVLAILATAAMPLVEMTARRAKERELKQAVWEIRAAIDAYKQAYDAGRIAPTGGASGFPPSLAVLADGVADAGAGGQPMYFLRRIPRDPFAANGVAAHQTWALRAYSSSGADPKPGADVYDVSSTSEAVGMNGIPYRQW